MEEESKKTKPQHIGGRKRTN